MFINLGLRYHLCNSSWNTSCRKPISNCTCPLCGISYTPSKTLCPLEPRFISLPYAPTPHDFKHTWLFTTLPNTMVKSYSEMFFIRPKKIIVWLSSTFFLRRGRQADFFFSNQSQSYRELEPLYLPMKVQISLLYQKKSLYKFKTILNWKQVENYNLKNIFERSKFSKKKKHLFLEFWKLGALYFCTYSKNFFSVFKN